MSDIHIREDHETGRIDVCDTSGPVHTTNHRTGKQEICAKDVWNDAAPNNRENIFKAYSGAPRQFAAVVRQDTPTASLWKPELTDCKTKVLKLESELKEQTALIQKLNESQFGKDEDMQALKIDLDTALRQSREAAEASVKEVQRLKFNIKEREKALDNVQLETSQWKTKYQKLETQIALIEKKAAQESLTSGSYPDDHANSGMLEAACKAVDKATEDLARFLHNISVTNCLPLNSVELEQIVRQISPAHPSEFSRAIQVRYVWSHWICFQIFRGCEHVFFDADGGQLTSPLDSKNHALECFRSFQQKQSTTSSDAYNTEGGLFQAFCMGKYRSVFPPWLVKQAFYPNSPDDVILMFNEYGRFNGNGEIFARFMDVARAIWLLHELAFSFDPAPTILRMARGTPCDKQFHEPVIPDEDSNGMSQMVVLMIRPGFRIRKSTVRSRVFLSKKPR